MKKRHIRTNIKPPHAKLPDPVEHLSLHPVLQFSPPEHQPQNFFDLPLIVLLSAQVLDYRVFGYLKKIINFYKYLYSESNK